MLASDPASLETLTMRPWPLARSRGSRLRLVCQAPSCLLPGVVVDGGVVDQDVQAAVAAVQGGGGLFGLGEVAGGEDNGVAPQGQLPGELLADAAVGAGDEHDAGHPLRRSALKTS
jgi:hypothetical protein